MTSRGLGTLLIDAEAPLSVDWIPKENRARVTTQCKRSSCFAVLPEKALYASRTKEKVVYACLEDGKVEVYRVLLLLLSACMLVRLLVMLLMLC